MPNIYTVEKACAFCYTTQMKDETTKKGLPSKIEKYLKYDVTAMADAKRAYARGIDIYERYGYKYLFDNDLKYNLGYLYDHAAIFSEKNKTIKKKYFEKAEKIYLSILA